MAKRGRILSDPTAGPGRVMVQGRQHAFGLDGVWQSDVLPRPGIVVDVEFDDAGHVRTMTAVSETRLAREQLEAALAFARSRGAEYGARFAGRFGLPEFAALTLLVVGWFWLDALEIDVSLTGYWQETFWQFLGALDAGRSQLSPGGESAQLLGPYRIVAVLCLSGPMLAGLWPSKYAHLASLLPLVLTFVVALHGFALWRPAPSQAISFGSGAYLAVLASVGLAFVGMKRFLVAKAHDVAGFCKEEQ